METGASYDVALRKHYGDDHAAAEQFWHYAAGPLSYRLRLNRRGYYDPFVICGGSARRALAQVSQNALDDAGQKWLGQLVPHAGQHL